MGVVDSILSMCAHKQIEDSIKLGGYDVLYKIFFEKKILSNYMMSTKLIETIKNDLIVINKQVFPEISLLKRNILKILLKILEQLSENPSILEKLFQENILETIIDILLSSKDKIDIVISICEALGSMAKKPHIIKQMLEFGCLELLMEFYDKYLSNLVALRALALLVGEMASNSIEAQEKLGCMAFPYLIIEGINLYRHDLALANSSFLSLSCLCYNNNKIGDFIVKSEIIKPIALNFVKNSLQNSELMGNIGLLFSNLCYKNHSNKKALGSFGCIQSLMNILEFYTKKDNLNEKTLKNCLK